MSQTTGRPRPLRRHDNEPAFAEPWQVDAHGLAELLVDGGVLEAGAWAEALGAALREEPEAPDPREHYYRAVLRTLERLMAARAGVVPEDLNERVEAWRRAYLRTPHGQPVDLSRGLERSGG